MLLAAEISWAKNVQHRMEKLFWLAVVLGITALFISRLRKGKYTVCWGKKIVGLTGDTL